MTLQNILYTLCFGIGEIIGTALCVLIFSYSVYNLFFK